MAGTRFSQAMEMDSGFGIVTTVVDLCLGFSSSSFVAMYDRAIEDGSYDHLCCDEAEGFVKGPGGNCRIRRPRDPSRHF